MPRKSKHEQAVAQCKKWADVAVKGEGGAPYRVSLAFVDLGSKSGIVTASFVSGTHGPEAIISLNHVDASKMVLGRLTQHYLQKFAGMDSDQVSAVFYEKVASHKGTLAAHRYGLLEGLLAGVCYDTDMELIPLPQRAAAAACDPLLAGNGSPKDRTLKQMQADLKAISSEDTSLDIWRLLGGPARIKVFSYWSEKCEADLIDGGIPEDIADAWCLMRYVFSTLLKTGPK